MRINIKQASDTYKIPYQTLYQQIRRGTNIGALFARDKKGTFRADEARVKAAAREWHKKDRGSHSDKAHKIGFRVTPAELKAIEANAKKAKKKVAEWCRDQALMGGAISE